MTPTKDHGSLGQNIKIHFAGAEAFDRAYICYDAGARYFLFTVLPFIMDQFNIKKWGSVDVRKTIQPYNRLPKMAKHVIMDSGLFSLMFGAYKDVRPDESFIRRYKDAICAFIHEKKAYTLTCVECDCQKLLGTELAWELRTQMRDQIPNKIINVFHFEDGKKGLDRMIEFSDYIAISVPELRIVKPKTYKDDTYRIASYIKNRKPEIDIHLLGGTEFDMIRQCKFCTSADSTSWISANRFGRVLGNHISTIKKDKYEEICRNTAKLLSEIDINPTESITRYFANYWASAYLNLQKYSSYAGSQD